MSFFAELKRRNVVRVGAAYIVFAWLVVQVVETIFPAFGFGDEAIRVVVIAAALGFIPALVFAWAFEWTPSGVQLDSDVARVEPVARRPTPTLDRLIVIVLTAALCFFAIDKFVIEPQRDAQLQQAARQEGASSALTASFDMGSIAVLPFVNISADADNEYFCDGIAAELLNLLSKVEGLRVISRSSSFFFKGKNVPISEIAAQLDVALVLEGSVRKVANQVRVTAQLVDARSDTNLWSATFDRELVDIFAIQDEISGAIVGELRSRMGDAVGDGPVASITNADAYDAYLRGKYLLTKRSPASKTAAVAQFRLALQSDENYAPAHAELAIALALGGDQSLLPEARSRQIEHHFSRALQLDPLLPEAYAARAVGYWLRIDPAGAKSDLEQAISLNPNYAQAYFWLSNTAETEQEIFGLE